MCYLKPKNCVSIVLCDMEWRGGGGGGEGGLELKLEHFEFNFRDKTLLFLMHLICTSLPK